MTLEKRNQRPGNLSLSFNERGEVTAAVLEYRFDIAEDDRVIASVGNEIDLMESLNDEEKKFFAVLSSMASGERPAVKISEVQARLEVTATLEARG